MTQLPTLSRLERLALTAIFTFKTSGCHLGELRRRGLFDSIAQSKAVVARLHNLGLITTTRGGLRKASDWGATVLHMHWRAAK